MRAIQPRLHWVLAAAATVLLAACASSKESASQDTLTENVGKYPAAPQGVNKPRVGVPPFDVKAEGSFGGGQKVDDLAADEMSTLLDQTDRFKVIERTQLKKLLDEQNMEGIVRPGELAKPGQVHGVDYLLLGKVTNLRVKTERKSTGFGLAKISSIAGGADVKKKDVTITTECGVDIRLVDPTTGETLTSNFSEYKRTDNAKAMGVDILGANASSDADIQISEDDKGKILRLALDDAVRKSLPKIDKFLKNQPAKGGSSEAPMPSNNSSNSSNMMSPDKAQPAAAQKFCPNCGAPLAAGAKFCPKCGAKVPD